MKILELQNQLDELGWSQAKLARRVGLNPNTVGRWVDGKVPLLVELYLGFALKMKRDWERLK